MNNNHNQQLAEMIKLSSTNLISLVAALSLSCSTVIVKGDDNTSRPNIRGSSSSSSSEVFLGDVENTIELQLHHDYFFDEYDVGDATLAREEGEINRHRNLGLWGAIQDAFTECPAGNVGDDCSIVCPRQSPNSCEAWSHLCRAPGNVGDDCSLTRPCRDGLNCEVGPNICRELGDIGDTCSFTRPCQVGLACEGGTNICREAGKHGDRCHRTRPCADGYWCVDSITSWNYRMCIPDCTRLTSSVTSKISNDGYSGEGFPGFDQKWEGGLVPFEADCEMENNEPALFSQGMKHIEDNTGIRFVRYDPSIHNNWIVFTDLNEGVASSWVGRMQRAGWQQVNLDTDWFGGVGHDLGSAIHEIMHVLGWEHTHARPDRDQYVTVLEENIQHGKRHNFNTEYSNVYNLVQRCRGYDYESIMHYSDGAFSKDGELTIVAKNSNYQDIIGQANALSEQDIEEINDYYFGNSFCTL